METSGGPLEELGLMFAELLTEVKTHRFEERRADVEDYFEGVLLVENMPGVCAALEKYFGKAFKPAGKAPSKEDSKRTDHLGGVQKNQVLYYVEKENQSNCAMLWPWQDGVRVTLKIAQGLLKR
jgi:hypothetical protein